MPAAWEENSETRLPSSSRQGPHKVTNEPPLRQRGSIPSGTRAIIDGARGSAMSGIAWETTHSVDSHASLPFAWTYMTNVANWDDPPAAFELEGPFTAGTRGKTSIPGQEPRLWQITKVQPLESYLLETELDRAALSFEWWFEKLAGGTRLTQHIVLKGENAGTYVSQVQAGFASNLAAGYD